MFRIDDPSAATSMPAPEAAGSEGYWTEGNPATGVPATLERASWFNMIQEELRAVTVAGGQTPSKTSFNQVLLALQAMYGAGRAGHVFGSTDWVPLPGGLILQWGPAYISNGSGNAVYPIAFPNACLRIQLTITGVGASTALIGAVFANPNPGKSTCDIYGASSQTVSTNFLVIGY